MSEQQLCNEILANSKALIKEPLFMINFIDRIPDFNRSGINTLRAIINSFARWPCELKTAHNSGVVGVFKKIHISL